MKQFNFFILILCIILSGCTNNMNRNKAINKIDCETLEIHMLSC